MRPKYLFLFFIVWSTKLFAQQQTLHGIVVDESGVALSYVSAAMLEPADSTLAFFGISDSEGAFEIKNVAPGKYLLQLALIGYQTRYVNLEVPIAAGSLGAFVLSANPLLLDGVEVKAERIPLQLKGDTLEYNAAAFKTQPDASVEDLLKKLPGVQVDQAGNIKAQGETVEKVYVDGKEFFSSDPKVATKNLPADAVNKVQVFDKKSDEAEFTGIDDGSRSKSINLLLKEDKKSAWMGDAEAGAGTGSHYQAAAKVYRFSHTNQFAALAMLNNINQFGFSFSDYIDFNGGVGALMGGGGGLRISNGDDNDLPIDFGQQINGLITSGAGGLNFTHEAKPGNRINISYLGNGYNKALLQTTKTQNFVPGSSFTTDGSSDQNNNTMSNRLNFNFRNAPDSMQRIFANGSASLTGGKSSGSAITKNYSSDSLTNMLTSETYEKSAGIKGNAMINYLRKGSNDWNVFKSDLSLSAKRTLSQSEWDNLTSFFPEGESSSVQQYQDDINGQVDYEGGFSASRRMGEKFFLVPALRLGGTSELLNREQGTPNVDESKVDSLSPDFSRSNQWLQTGAALKYSSKKTQWRMSLAAKGISLQNILNEGEAVSLQAIYFVPQLELESEIKRGQRIRFSYETSVDAPGASQLLPVTNNINPLELFTGNRNLKPEYNHDVRFHYMLFDQFSFTSLFTMLHFGYTKDKINYSKTIDDQLGQSLTLVNVSDDYTASAEVEFSTPIRPAGLNIHASLTENYNRGINYVNDVANTINAFTHQLNLTFDNRKKEKLELDFGGQLSFNTGMYSLQAEMNSRFFNWSYFVALNYVAVKNWRFSVNADVNHYGLSGYGETNYVPLLQAAISRYFLKGNRGVISLKAFDLLNQNTGITQTTEFNYFQQQQSNTIGRYAMLSFKYRLNKFDSGKGGVDIKVNGR